MNKNIFQVIWEDTCGIYESFIYSANIGAAIIKASDLWSDKKIISVEKIDYIPDYPIL
jgi:ABC-type cobalt transport system substrate-binding protein